MNFFLIFSLLGLLLTSSPGVALADGAPLQEARIPPTPGCPQVPTLNHFVDTFNRVDYRLGRGFDPQNGYLSTLLRLTYSDGVTIDLDFNTIDDDDVDVSTVSRQFRNAHWGPKCRLFPERLNQRTTPNLYSAKQKALRIIHEHNAEFIDLAAKGIFLLLPIPVGGLRPAPEPWPDRVPSAFNERVGTTSRGPVQQEQLRLGDTPSVGSSVQVIQGSSRQVRGVGAAVPVGLIDPALVGGKSPGEIDQFAKSIGLIAKGPDPAHGRGAYVDPVTGRQRILIHPEPKNGRPHCHINNPNGDRVGVDGQVVPDESPAAHLPLRYP